MINETYVTGGGWRFKREGRRGRIWEVRSVDRLEVD